MMINIKSVIATIIALPFIISCAYDDTELKEKVNEIDNRLVTLEQTVKDMNESISSLMTIVNALKTQDQIVSVMPLEDGTGYTVTLSKSGVITIRNGSDGKPGSDGHSPSINIKLDIDGNYYWTLDDKFITDDAGNRIPATSTTLIPQIRINEGNFELSFDGTKWEVIGSAGSAGIFREVIDGEDSVKFILSNGESIVIPKVQQFALVIKESSIPVTPGTQTVIDYEITAPDEGTVIDILTTGGLVAKLKYNIAGRIEKGTIIVDIPNPLVEGKVFVFAVNGKGTTSARIISFEEGVFEYEVTGNLDIPVSGKSLEIPIRTNYSYEVYIPEEAKNWVSAEIFPMTRTIREEMLLITIAKNSGEARNTIIYLMQGSSASYPIMIEQDGAGSIDEPGYKGSIDDWKYDGSINM